MNIEEIYNTIDELENGETTFDSCNKLASLYIIRNFYNSSDSAESEMYDILPSYSRYKESKLRFQKGEIEKTALLNDVSLLYKEVKEFIKALYSTTDTQAERELLHIMINELEDIF